MDSFNLIQLTDRFLERDRAITEERLPHMYPSEARCICENTGKVLGNCLRSSYYRLTGVEQTNPPNARFHYIFMLGRLVEQFLVDRWKEMGIWLDGNVPFVDMEDGYIVSGKIDCFIRNWTRRTMIIGVEVKSFYGYHATREIIGTANQEGRPKMDQLLQTLYYAERYRHRGVPGFKMAYLARDSTERREFNVIPTVTSVGGEVQRIRPAVDGTIYPNVSVEGIRSSYGLLDQAVREDTLPCRDFKKVFSNDEVEAKYGDGEISKSAYDKWRRNRQNNPLGDWQCRYCWYENHCYRRNAGEGTEIILREAGAVPERTLPEVREDEGQA